MKKGICIVLSALTLLLSVPLPGSAEEYTYPAMADGYFALAEDYPDYFRMQDNAVYFIDHSFLGNSSLIVCSENPFDVQRVNYGYVFTPKESGTYIVTVEETTIDSAVLDDAVADVEYKRYFSYFVDTRNGETAVTCQNLYHPDETIYTLNSCTEDGDFYSFVNGFLPNAETGNDRYFTTKYENNTIRSLFCLSYPYSKELNRKRISTSDAKVAELSMTLGAKSALDADDTLTLFIIPARGDGEVTITANEKEEYCLKVENGVFSYRNAPDIQPKPKGDINNDGAFNTADIVLLQKWLLTDPETQLAKWEAADYNDDHKLNAFDLSLLKQDLLMSIVPDCVEPDVRLDSPTLFAVQVDGLKLSLGPDESYETVASISAGSRLSEIGYQKDNNSWIYTQFGGQFGWVPVYQDGKLTLTAVNGGFAGFGKPVIYLYPEQETDVHVELELTDSELSTTYPKYNNGWDVTAYPDGTLVNKADGTHHRYLFWDSVNSRTQFDYSKGFCVPGSDTERFLKEKLTYMGLNEEEMNEFIVYWLPKLEHNAYNLIAFQSDAYTNVAKLTVTPAPDSECRIFMAYVPLETPIEIEPQQLETFERKGFALVEWGGLELQ